jgi:signal transduction histidine kinase
MARRRRPAAADVLLALVLGVEMQLEVLLLAEGTRDDLLAAHLSMAALAGALVFRVVAPEIAAAVAIAVLSVLERLGPGVDADLVGPFFATLAITYSVGRHSEGRRFLVGMAVLVVGCAIAIRLDEPPGGAGDFLFAGTIIIGAPVLLGRLVRSRVKLNQALRDRAAAAEADREARAAGAVVAERERIAGELHHLVSDALAAMVGAATTAEELSRSRPEGAEAAFADVETTGREALGEIRRLLGVLRREDEELALAPQPSLVHLADLVARVRASGLPVELAVEGEQAPVPAGVDLTAYRVVQQALGGALEEADGRRAAVRLRYAADELALEVTDTGDAQPGGERPLLGMRERVALYGGELVAEPVDGSGYAVRARLPLERA